jgi:hypothetical protein
MDAQLTAASFSDRLFMPNNGNAECVVDYHLG